MNNTIFTGSGVAIVTPMFENGSVNYEKLGTLIDWQIEQNTDAIIACGTTGESPVLSDEEHCEVIRYTVDRVKKRVPVIAGTGSNDTAYAVWLSEQAEKDGADGLLLVTPYYNKTSQTGLVRQFNHIADHVNIPIILYNVPSRTGINMTVNTYLELSKHKNIAAIKEASGNLSQVAETLAACGDSLDIYSGNDDQIVPIMSLGGKGVISVCANIIPSQTHDVCAACLDGDFKKGAALQLEYLELMNALFLDVNPIPVKEALNIMGLDVGQCRMPLAPLDPAVREKLIVIMKKYQLI